MDDLARRLDSGSTRILLYGDPGIGKTRLLEEFCDRRLAGERIHWIDLGAMTSDDVTQIEALFEGASSGDYLIADHFDRGHRSLRDQLMHSSAGVGRAKGLRMIVASRYYLFNELRRLCHQYHVRVKSVQQMPLNNDEVLAFLRFRLYGDLATGKLGMPMPVRRQIIDARGNLRRVLEIGAQDESQIALLPPATGITMFRGRRMIVVLLALCALAGGFGWHLFSGKPDKADEIAPGAAPAAMPGSHDLASSRGLPSGGPVARLERRQAAGSAPRALRSRFGGVESFNLVWREQVSVAAGEAWHFRAAGAARVRRSQRLRPAGRVG